MRIYKFNLLLIILAITLVFSCKKDNFEDLIQEPIEEVSAPSLNSSSFDNFSNTSANCIDEIDKSHVSYAKRSYLMNIVKTQIPRNETESYGQPVYSATITEYLDKSYRSSISMIPIYDGMATNAILLFLVDDSSGGRYFIMDKETVYSLPKFSIDVSSTFPDLTFLINDDFEFLFDAFDYYLGCKPLVNSRCSNGCGINTPIQNIFCKIGGAIKDIGGAIGGFFGGITGGNVAFDIPFADFSGGIFNFGPNILSGNSNPPFNPPFLNSILLLQVDCDPENDPDSQDGAGVDNGMVEPEVLSFTDRKIHSHWCDYKENCLGDDFAGVQPLIPPIGQNANYGQNPYYQWANALATNTQIFRDVTQGKYGCVSLDELDLVECVGEIFDEFVNANNLQIDTETSKYIKNDLINSGVCGDEEDIAEALFNKLNESLDLDDNKECLMDNVSMLSQMSNFMTSDSNCNEESKSIKSIIADSFADGYCEDPTNPMFNNAVPFEDDDPLLSIIVDQVKQLAFDMVADLVPGGSLLTTGPEFLEHIKLGNYMEAVYSFVDIALNEAEHCFPVAKAASIVLGTVDGYKQIKKLVKTFNNMKHLGRDVIEKVYTLFIDRLGWDANKINNLFNLLENEAGDIAGTQNALLEGITGGDFFEELKDVFGAVETVTSNDVPPRVAFKIGEIPVNRAIYVELYPDANSGWAWTLEFSFGPANGANYNDLASAFKIRFNQ